jgi:enamine deaminase RidA (YjgF/YER057c/UK114 family)
LQLPAAATALLALRACRSQHLSPWAVSPGTTVGRRSELGPVYAQTKEFAAEDVEGQAEQVMLNLGAVLEAAGSSFSKARACAQPPARC